MVWWNRRERRNVLKQEGETEGPTNGTLTEKPANRETLDTRECLRQARKV